MLFHLFRGSGLTGLCGIKPKRDAIIRPILCLERSEIEYYLACIKVPFCIDSTNQTDEYTRNKIRNNVIPYVENNITMNAVTHISYAAQIVLETEDYIDYVVNSISKECMNENGICISAFEKQHPYLQKRMIYNYIKSNSTEYKDITSYHIEQVQNLFHKKNNAQIDLPHKLKAIRKNDYIVLEKQKDGYALVDIDLEQFEINVTLLELENHSQYFPIGNWGYLECTILDPNESTVIPQNKYTKWFDYDKIEKSFIVRRREIGDYFLISSKKDNTFHTKKIKDFMINQKISKALRDQIPLLTVGNHVLWVMGYRICEGYNINKDTKRILQIKWITCK